MQVVHYIVPRPYMRILLLEMRQQLAIFQHRFRQQVMLRRLCLGEQTLCLGNLFHACVRNGNAKYVFPLTINLQTATFPVHFILFLHQHTRARLERTHLLVP